MPISAPLTAVIRLVRLDRPIGIWLLLWPPLWSLWLAAEGMPPLDLLVIFVLGVVLMRSAGCAINDYADRDLDRRVARTRDRPLARGDLKPETALWVTAALLLAALGLAWLLPLLSLVLAVPAALLALTYPFAKRFHHLPQLHLGIAFAWSIPMAITAVTHAWPPVWGWLLFTATVLWVVAYDTLYAMADRAEDLIAGNRSTAILLGEADLAAVALLQRLFMIALILLGLQLHLGIAYYLGLGVAGACIGWQLRIARSRQSAHCFKAFTNNAWVGAAIWVGLVAALWDTPSGM